MDEVSEVRMRRAAAAEKYRPHKIDVLLIAEAPPSSPDRYFYFLDVREQDALFRYVSKSLFGVPPTRDKAPVLEQLKAARVFLIDVKLDPIERNDLGLHVPDLIRRCQNLAPRHIVLIKASVFDV